MDRIKSRKQFLSFANEIVRHNAKVITESEGKSEEELTFKDTIQIVMIHGHYTLLHYFKGGDEEWNVARNYNSETKTWDAGNYCYSWEDALETMLEKMKGEW